MSGTANTGIYLSGSVYAAGSEQRNLVEQNTVSGAGGDGIYLQSVNTSSTAQKNTVKSVAGSGIRVNAGKNNNVLGNICLSNKNHGVKIEYVAGGVRVKSNRVTSNAKVVFCSGNQKYPKYQETVRRKIRGMVFMHMHL